MSLSRSPNNDVSPAGTAARRDSSLISTRAWRQLCPSSSRRFSLHSPTLREEFAFRCPLVIELASKSATGESNPSPKGNKPNPSCPSSFRFGFTCPLTNVFRSDRIWARDSDDGGMCSGYGGSGGTTAWDSTKVARETTLADIVFRAAAAALATSSITITRRPVRVDSRAPHAGTAR